MWSISRELIPFFVVFVIYTLWYIRPLYNKLLGLYFVTGFFYSLFDTTFISLPVKLLLWSIPLLLVVVHLLKHQRFILRNSWRFLLFSILYSISCILNKSHLPISIFYYMDYLVPFCLFFIGINLKTTRDKYYSIFRLIGLLFLFQVLASLIKFLKYGAVEPIVGSIQTLSGSASTVLVLVMISCFISFYLVTREKKYIYGLLLPLFIGLTSEKRVIWFYIPMLIISIVLIYNAYEKTLSRSIRVIVPVVLLTIVAVYVGVRFSPTLNPENKMWGSFDVDYALNYAEEYNLSESEEGEATQRFSGALATLEEMKSWSSSEVLFGQGPTFVDDYVENEKGFKWGFWGRETAFSMFLISYGVLGLFSLYFFLFGNLKYAVKAYKMSHGFEKGIALMVIGFFVIYVLDFLYSRSAIENHILSPLMFFFAGYCVRLVYSSNNPELK